MNGKGQVQIGYYKSKTNLANQKNDDYCRNEFTEGMKVKVRVTLG